MSESQVLGALQRAERAISTAAGAFTDVQLERDALQSALDDERARNANGEAALESLRTEHADLLAAHGNLQREMDALTADEVRRRPLLGLATTQQLLDEVATRVEVHGPGLQYRTVDPH